MFFGAGACTPPWCGYLQCQPDDQGNPHLASEICTLPTLHGHHAARTAVIPPRDALGAPYQYDDINVTSCPIYSLEDRIHGSL